MNVLFVAYYPGYVSLQSPTRCITLLSFYIPWSLLKVIIYVFFSGNLRRKALLVVTADNLTLLPTFRACTGCITEVKVLFVILCFVYIFFCLFCCCCCCCCHFRCFYCKMSSYGVNLVSLIHVCWKCALIRLLTIKKTLLFPEICLWIHVRPRESHNKWDTLFFSPQIDQRLVWAPYIDLLLYTNLTFIFLFIQRPI